MIYVIGETNRKRNCQLISKAIELETSEEKRGIKLIFFGSKVEEIHKNYAVNEIILLRNSGKQVYCNIELFAQEIIRLVKNDSASLILFPSIPLYRELAALLSARMERALLTDCTNIWKQNEDYMAIKPSLNGTHFSTYRFEGEKPYLAVTKTIDVKLFPQGKEISDIHIIDIKEDVPKNIRLVEINQAPKTKKDIRNAEIIFAGGRGMLNEDSFHDLRKLADIYHASIGASRPVVDSGWASVDEQVGQTGSFVRPKVYLAFGISGAVQHIAGMKESQYIIAVNNQKNSPIFRYCDYGVYGDANSIIRNMLRLLCHL